MDRARAVPELDPAESQTRVKAGAPDPQPVPQMDDEHDRPTLVPASDALEARVLFETRAAIERRLAIGEEHRPTRRIDAKHTLKGLVAPRRQVLPTAAPLPVSAPKPPVAASLVVALPAVASSVTAPPPTTAAPKRSPRAGRRHALWIVAVAIVATIASVAYAYRELLASLLGT